MFFPQEYTLFILPVTVLITELSCIDSSRTSEIRGKTSHSAHDAFHVHRCEHTAAADNASRGRTRARGCAELPAELGHARGCVRIAGGLKHTLHLRFGRSSAHGCGEAHACWCVHKQPYICVHILVYVCTNVFLQDKDTHTQCLYTHKSYFPQGKKK